MYESGGTRIRLAAQGDTTAAALLEYVEGSDTAFNSTTGGTGLGGATHPYFQGVVLNNAAYFTDRAGALRKYERAPASGNQVRSVALPTRPSAAPGVKAKTFEVLDKFAGNAGVAPFGWTESDAAGFAIQDGTSTVVSPFGGITALLNTLTTPVGDTISENVSGEAVPSDTIAFWVWATNYPSQIAFRYGQVTATDFSEPVSPTLKETWVPIFVRIGNLGTINYKQFVVTQSAGAADVYISWLVLPGRLQGSYRYVYTHYDSTLQRESEPSDISNNGTPLDLSAIGTSGETGSAAAFQKSAALNFTSDSGTDSTTNKIRIYRSGGVPALTQDSRGLDVWCRVGEITDFSTTVSGAHSAGATALVVASGTSIANGDWLVIEKGTVSKEEYVRVTAGGGTANLTISNGLLYAHSGGVAVQIAFVDNVPNTQVDLATRIFLERDDPPAASRFVARSPDGRLWGFNYSGKPTGVWVSNKATPERPADYEVAPDGVDPTTRSDPLQGWRFEIGGDVTDEEITWGGFFRDRPFAFTRRKLYAINALSQTDWGPDAIVKALEIGCIAGDTVQEVNGVLYWVADGPRVMRWDGQGPPEVLSHTRVNERLAAAEPDLWSEWFATYHARPEGHYYRLYYAAPEEGACALDIGPVDAATCETVSGLLAWFRADSLTLNDGDGVSSWTDSSGNGNTATRATVAEQPTYASDSIPGGGPVVRFRTASKGLDITNLSVTRGSYTFYLLYRNTPDSPAFGLLLSAASGGGGLVVQPDRSPSSTLMWDLSGVSGIEAPAVCGWQCVTVVADSAGGSMLLYRNGVLLTSGAYSAGVETDGTWLLGAGTGTSTGLVFDLAEVQLYDTAHDAATIAAKSVCLRSRWNLREDQGV
jgi:hypothetical protein